jgi:hypothetical protein
VSIERYACITLHHHVISSEWAEIFGGNGRISEKAAEEGDTQVDLRAVGPPVADRRYHPVKDGQDRLIPTEERLGRQRSQEVAPKPAFIRKARSRVELNEIKGKPLTEVVGSMTRDAVCRSLSRYPLTA